MPLVGAGSHLNKRRRKDENTCAVWRLLQCQNMECKWIHSRDGNAAFNLLRVALVIPHGLPRPAYLCRPRGGGGGSGKKKNSPSPRRSSRKRRSTKSARGSDRAMGTAGKRQRWTSSDTLLLSSSGTAEPERPVVPRDGTHRVQAYLDYYLATRSSGNPGEVCRLTEGAAGSTPRERCSVGSDLSRLTEWQS